MNHLHVVDDDFAPEGDIEYVGEEYQLASAVARLETQVGALSRMTWSLQRHMREQQRHHVRIVSMVLVLYVLFFTFLTWAIITGQ